jgi:hypothetical protein
MKNLKILLKRNLKNENFRFILSFFILQFLAIPFIYYSTVTDLAKFLGWSTSLPLHTATW